MKKVLIFDFDGTMTNAEEEGKPYRHGYLEDLALICDLNLTTIIEWAAEFDEIVSENQDKFGWKFNGSIVAPASVDPYLRIMPTARLILERAQVLPDTNVRDRILDRILYKYNYTKTQTVFRPHAAELISKLDGSDEFMTYVVTNSHTEPVQNKLRLLQKENPEAFIDWLVPKVYGSAKKYIIDQEAPLPEFINIPNLNRKILLKRGHYHSVITQLLQIEGLGWSDVIVIGDIFELDLCLPLAMGAEVGLVLSEFTPEYERQYLETHPKGHTFASLEAVSDYLFDK